MSTEQTVDPELVEQTKQQIRHLVREIAALSKSDTAPQQYYDALLNRVVSALAAVGGAVWTLDQGRLDLQYQIGLRQTGLADSPENQQRHGRLLHRVLQTGEGMLVAPHSGTGDDEEAANPTPFLLLLGPLKSDQEVQGVVEVFQRPDTALSVQQGYLRFLLQMCDLAGDYLKTRSLRHFTDRQTLWAQLEQFTRLVHRSLDPRSTAYTIANEGRRLIECDRVSVGICRAHKCRIEAVSGQDTFDKRSNVVSLLARLATAVTATGETIWYTGDTSRMAPQVEEAVQAYIDESHSKVVGVIPLRRPVEETTPEKQREDDPGEVIGALIVEQIEDSRPHEGLLSRVEVIGLHGSTALANALEYHHIFLLPLWLALGRASWVLKARTLPKTMAVAVGRGQFSSCGCWSGRRLSTWKAKGRSNRPRSGTCSRAWTASSPTCWSNMANSSSGEKCWRGCATPTWKRASSRCTATWRALWKKCVPLHACADQTQARRRRYRPRGGGTRRAEKARDQLQGAAQSPGEKAGTTGRHQSHRRPGQHLARRRVAAPPARQAGPGLDERCRSQRPMGAGNSHARGTHRTRGLGADWNPVQIYRCGSILQVSPGDEHDGVVDEVHAHAEVRPEEGNTVLVRVAFDKTQLNPTDMTQGATVTAKINCGRVPIGYKYFHDVIAFIQMKILFRL